MGADVQDLYIVDDYGDGIHYWSNGQLLEYNVTMETITVRGSSNVINKQKKGFLRSGSIDFEKYHLWPNYQWY